LFFAPFLSLPFLFLISLLISHFLTDIYGVKKIAAQASLYFILKSKDYLQLMKFTLSFTVVFTCVICYLLAPNVVEYSWPYILLLFAAGLMITGSANAINQAVEKDTDAVMKRTGMIGDWEGVIRLVKRWDVHHVSKERPRMML